MRKVSRLDVAEEIQVSVEKGIAIDGPNDLSIWAGIEIDDDTRIKNRDILVAAGPYAGDTGLDCAAHVATPLEGRAIIWNV